MKFDPFELPPAAECGGGPDVEAPVAAPTPQSYVGPFDREAWPERLTARVVSPGPEPRIHGYAVAADLARHAGIADVAWLTVRGELPSAEQRAAFEVAIVLLTPVHLGQAASHAAYLSRIGGATTPATVAIGAVGLGELSRHERTELEPWQAWLAGGAIGEVPDCARAHDASPDALAAQRWLDGQLRTWLGPRAGLPATPLTRVACAHAILHQLGLTDPLALDALTTWARLLAVTAEAAFARIGGVRQYPARLPDYQYIDGQGAQP